MNRWNGKTIMKREIDMIIESDASLEGWEQCALIKKQEIHGHRQSE